MTDNVVEFFRTPGVSISDKVSLFLCVDVCTRQFSCLSSVDSPSLALGDQSRVSRGCLERKESDTCFRVNSLFELALVSGLSVSLRDCRSFSSV